MTGKISNVEGNLDEFTELRELVIKSNLETAVKCEFIKCVLLKNKNMSAQRKLCFEFFHASRAAALAKNKDNIEDWINFMISALVPTVEEYSKEQINRVFPMIVYELKNRNSCYNDLFCRFTEFYKEKGGIW